ncbi:MAG: hypothetical protein JWN06_2553 [Propionibacteriaceae bacterium]|nr:hypothetical protein [Propionibacteriaceae bacterium]
MAEPTSTNTLPPPPRPSRPAPSTAGRLTSKSLPVPAGWHPVTRKGGAEEGYQGNGTWVHQRDPRYAARDAITIGCADVSRDDYSDPVAALEGTYESPAGDPGIGLVLQFGTTDAAKGYYARYVQQVSACTSEDGPVVAEVIPSDQGLIDRRSYPDGDWTEVAALRRSRVTLVILTDPGHKISTAAAERLLAATTSG